MIKHKDVQSGGVMRVDLDIGDAVRAEVVSLKPYGAFVRLPDGEVGLIHISEVADEYVKDITEYLMIGQEVIAKIIGRNSEGKFNLSLKQVTKQDEAAAQYRIEMEELSKKRQALANKFTNLQVGKSESVPVEAAQRQALRLWIKGAKQMLNELQRKGRLHSSVSENRARRQGGSHG